MIELPSKKVEIRFINRNLLVSYQVYINQIHLYPTSELSQLRHLLRGVDTYKTFFLLKLNILI